MTVWRERVYFIGGWYEDDNSGERVLVDTVDVYDFASDVWTVETRIPTPRYHAGMVIVADKLYVIGGFHSDSLFDNRATEGTFAIKYRLGVGDISCPKNIYLVSFSGEEKCCCCCLI
jgi:hypothetical protein